MMSWTILCTGLALGFCVLALLPPLEKPNLEDRVQFLTAAAICYLAMVLASLVEFGR